MKPKPCHPFQELAGDLCSCAYRNYLNLADCLTDWPDIFPLTKYNSSSVGHYDQAIILPHWRTRDILVRQRSVIHDQCIPEFLQAMGIQPQDSNWVISTEQWQSRSDSEDHKKHNLGRMERPWQWKTLPCPFPVQKHTLMQRWIISHTETLSPPSTGHATSSLPHLCSWARWPAVARRNGGCI